MKNILILFILLTFSSCLGTKKTTERNKELVKTEISNSVKDSVSIKEVSKAINDNVAVSLRTNNKVVDSIIKERLKGFVSRKTSGSNSYSAKFDYDRMVLDIASIIGETSSNTTNTSLNTKTQKTVSETTDEYIKEIKNRIPWWIYVVALIYFLPKLIEGVNTVANPISLLFKKFK